MKPEHLSLLQAFAISPISFIGAIVFGIAGMSFGTGMGFIIRGQINKESILYTLSGTTVLLSCYFLHKLLIKKLSNHLFKVYKVSGNVGAAVFVMGFIYYVVLGNFH